MLTFLVANSPPGIVIQGILASITGAVPGSHFANVQIWNQGDALPSDWPSDDLGSPPGMTVFRTQFDYSGPPLSLAAYLPPQALGAPAAQGNLYVRS